jgi:hypothetical protein
MNVQSSSTSPFECPDMRSGSQTHLQVRWLLEKSMSRSNLPQTELVDRDSRFP